MTNLLMRLEADILEEELAQQRNENRRMRETSAIACRRSNA